MREKLFSSIKHDDAALFGKHMASEGFSALFGRFSLLSLLYLYGAKRILKKYLPELLKERPRTHEPSFFEAEALFRKKAGKTLRHFTEKEISPLEMLAALGERRTLQKLYPHYPNHVRYLASINRIWLTRTGKEARVAKDKLFLPAAPLSSLGKRTFALFTPVFLGIGVAFLAVTLSLSAYFGWGTSKVYYKVHTAGEMVSALSHEQTILLKKDVALSSGVESYGAAFEGEGHVVRLKKPMAEIFSGEMRNVTFLLESGFQGDAVILENRGRLTNVRVIAEGKQAKGGEYMSALTAVNKGKIENCTAALSLDISGDSGGNCYYAAFAGKNEGSIVDCALTGSVTARNVDVGGIAGTNGKEGKITNCSVNAALTESSDLKGWTPNVAGVVCHNEGRVENCSVSSGVSSVLRAPDRCSEMHQSTLPEAKLQVEYCDCDSFPLFCADSPSPLDTQSSHVSDSLAAYFDDVALYYSYLMSYYTLSEGQNDWQITIGNNRAYSNYYYFVLNAKNAFDNANVSLTKSIEYSVNTGALIGLNRDFTLTFGTDKTLAEFRTVLARLFGFVDAEDFISCAEKTAAAYLANSPEVTDTYLDRTNCKGAVYTASGAFVLPFAFKNELSDTPLLALVIIDAEGGISVWLHHAEVAFRVTNYDNALQTEELATLALYGRCSLFDSIPSSYAAGIACENAGSVKNCVNEGPVTATAQNGASFAGGIITLNASVTTDGITSVGVIEHCSGLGEVLATSTTNNSYAGGIAALNEKNSSILSSRQVASVRAQSEGSVYDFTGGIVAQNSGSVRQSFFIGRLDNFDEDSAVGAICGVHYLHYNLWTGEWYSSIGSDNAFVSEGTHACGAVISDGDAWGNGYNGLRTGSVYTAYLIEHNESFGSFSNLLDLEVPALTLDELKTKEIYYE